jgi:hypothetical protein
MDEHECWRMFMSLLHGKLIELITRRIEREADSAFGWKRIGNTRYSYLSSTTLQHC